MDLRIVKTYFAALLLIGITGSPSVGNCASKFGCMRMVDIMLDDIQPHPINYQHTGIRLNPDLQGLSFFDPATGSPRNLSTVGPNSFISAEFIHPKTRKPGRWAAKVEEISVDPNGALHVRVELPDKYANGLKITRELTESELISARVSEASQKGFEAIAPKPLAHIPGVKKIEETPRGTLITTDRGIIGDIDENHRYISAVIQGRGPNPIPMRISRIFTENNHLQIEVEIAIEDPNTSYIRDNQGNLNQIKWAFQKNSDDFPKTILRPTEYATANVSKYSRDLFQRYLRIRTEPEGMRVYDPKSAGRPAGEFNLKLADQLIANPQEVAQMVQNAEGTLKNMGAQFKFQVDSMGRRLQSSALESESQKQWLRENLSPKKELAITQALNNIYVYQIEKLPPPIQPHPLTPALRHPEMARDMEIMRSFGVRLDIDPGLEVVSSGAQFNSSSRSIVIEPHTAWHKFKHEFQHMLFSELGMDNLYTEMTYESKRGRLSELLKEPRYTEAFQKFRSYGISDSILQEYVNGAASQVPLNAINETTAVQAELDGFISAGYATSSPEYRQSRRYALKWQIYELTNLRKAGPLTPEQKQRLATSEKEYKSIK